jgi:predicted transport protein
MYLVSFLYSNASLMANHLEISNEALKNMLKFHEEKIFLDDIVLRDMKKRLVALDNLNTLEKLNINDLDSIANSTKMNLEVINTMLEANNEIINLIKSTTNEYGEL